MAFLPCVKRSILFSALPHSSTICYNTNRAFQISKCFAFCVQPSQRWRCWCSMNVQSNLVQSNLRRKSKWLCNLNTIPTLNMLTINDDLLLWKPGTYFWLGMWKNPNCSSTSKCLRFLYLRNGVFILNAIADLLSICRRYRLVLSVTWTTQISPFPHPSGAICVRMMEKNEFWHSDALQLV